MDCLAIGLAVSLHLGLANTYNPVHPYAMCETENTISGLYYNSLDTVSVFSAYKVPLGNNVSVDVGLVTGYVIPVAPMVRLKYKKLFLMPALEHEDTVGLVLGYDFKF